MILPMVRLMPIPTMLVMMNTKVTQRAQGNQKRVKLGHKTLIPPYRFIIALLTAG